MSQIVEHKEVKGKTDSLLFYILITLALPLIGSCSSLHRAAFYNDIQLLEKTISEGKEDIKTNPTPLIVAAQKGHSEVTEILLNAGANPNLTDFKNQTPLMWAASKNKPKIIKLLLEAKADTEIKESKLGQTALMIATIKKHNECVKLLLKGGASPNATSLNGSTPLIEASASQQLIAVKLLLESGANPNLTNNRGVTPLLFAVSKQDLEITKMLIKNGAYLDAQHDTGATPLTLASTFGNLAIVKELIVNGADINKVETMFGTTPLLQAGIKKHYSIAEYLIKQGANKYIPDYKGRTLRQLAIITNDNRLLEIARFNAETIKLAEAESELYELQNKYQGQKIEYENMKREIEKKEMFFLKHLNDNQLELYSKYIEYVGNSANKAKILLSFREFNGSLDVKKKKEYVSLYSDKQKSKSYASLLETINLNLEKRKQIIEDTKEHISKQKAKSIEEDNQSIAALKNRQQAIVAQQRTNTTNWLKLLAAGLNSFNEAQKAAYQQYESDRKHRELINSINDIERVIRYPY